MMNKNKYKVVRMIKKWLLARLLKNKIVFFELDNGYCLITDISFDEYTDVIICKNTKGESDLND